MRLKEWDMLIVVLNLMTWNDCTTFKSKKRKVSMTFRFSISLARMGYELDAKIRIKYKTKKGFTDLTSYSIKRNTKKITKNICIEPNTQSGILNKHK